MQISCFTVADSYPEVEFRRHEDLVNLACVSEKAGLAAFWIAEHHFHSGGVCPSPSVFLAAAGSRTRRIRLGSLVSVLPLHSPLAVAEEYSLLDRLCSGRLNFGVGSGYIPLEFEGFGQDVRAKQSRFDECLSIVLDAFQGGEVRLKEGAGRGVRLNVQPVQRPHPPIWIAVQRREVLPYVARRGFSVALLPYATVENVSQLAASIHEFRGALPFGIRAQVSVAVHLYLGRDLEAARRALQRFLDSRMAVQADYFRGPLRVPPVRAQAQWLEDRLFALFGNRHEIESGIETFRSAGVDELLGIYDFGGLKIGSARATINRMSKLRESFDAALVPPVDSEPGPPKVVAQPAAVDSSGSYCRGAQRPILRSG